jgi:hypothetical protein
MLSCSGAVRPGTAGATLSDKLSRQRGTLMPPAVDSRYACTTAAAVARHHAGDPPPGTPGGDQKLVPK